MAETTPSSSVTPPPPPPPPTPPSSADNPDPSEYWCYQCNKRVPIETLPGQADVICFECKNGFVELIAAAHHHRHQQPVDVNDDDHPVFGNEFLQVLRLIAMSARDDDAPPLPPAERDGDVDDNDYLRIELDGWDENDENDDDVDDDDDDDNEDNGDNEDQVHDGSDDDNGDNEDNENGEQIVEPEDEDLRRRRQRDVIRLRLRDFASRALSRRHRILDWAEILTGLEDHSVEFRFQAAGDGYIGNPGDYLDAAGYEALLQTLAESDPGKRGPPPAAKSAVEGLPTVKVNLTDVEFVEACAICKDKLVNNEEEVVKQLPCGHMYHEECIVPWLGSRNTCPVCRFELATDDPEYEEDRKKRANAMATTSAGSDDAV